MLLRLEQDVHFAAGVAAGDDQSFGVDVDERADGGEALGGDPALQGAAAGVDLDAARVLHAADQEELVTAGHPDRLEGRQPPPRVVVVPVRLERRVPRGGGRCDGVATLVEVV